MSIVPKAPSGLGQPLPPAPLDPARPDITYTWESFAGGAEEALPLMRKHYAEVYDWADKFPFNPMWHNFFELERMGMFHVLAVRRHGTLIGYLGIVVSPLIHCGDCIRARGDSFYIDPLYRGGRLGIHMFKEAERHMRELGVHRMELVPKETVIGKYKNLFERMGYRLLESTYGKLL